MLLDMVADVRRKLLGLELVSGLSKLDGSTALLGQGPTNALDNLDLSEAKRLTRRAVELIKDGVVGYTLIAARKK